MKYKNNVHKSPPERAFLEATSEAKEDTYRRVLDAIALKRRNPNLSAAEAARRGGTTLPTIQRYAGSALSFRGGRWTVAAHDTLPRRMLVLTDRGYISMLTKDSRDATLIAEHNNAIREFLVTGSQASLRRFEEYDFEDDDGVEHPFITDPRTINRLARAGAVSFLDIYDSEAE